MASEYEITRNIACGRYDEKVCGMRIVPTEYDGTFPMDDFIKHMEVPPRNVRPGLDPQHKRAWDYFYRAFDKVWKEY